LLDEQREIVTVVEAIDQGGFASPQRYLLEQLFKALLRQIMTGDLCLSRLDLSVLQPEPNRRASS
jgi:hypothetical protein